MAAGEGRRLVSLDELKKCVAAPGGGGEDAVRTFLLESPDIPASTLRWPAWRLKIVPNIMAQLLGISLKEEEHMEHMEQEQLAAAAPSRGTGALSSSSSRRVRGGDVVASASASAPGRTVSSPHREASTRLFQAHHPQTADRMK